MPERLFEKIKDCASLALVIGVLLALAVFGLWSALGDEPQFVDDITDPFAHIIHQLSS